MKAWRLPWRSQRPLRAELPVAGRSRHLALAGLCLAAGLAVPESDEGWTPAGWLADGARERGRREWFRDPLGVDCSRS
eukprot:7548569-Pyramimonas_sp.AAC.1